MTSMTNVAHIVATQAGPSEQVQQWEILRERLMGRQGPVA